MDDNQTPAGDTEDVEAHAKIARVGEEDSAAHLQPLRREMGSGDAETATPGFRGPTGNEEDDTEAHLARFKLHGDGDDVEAHAVKVGRFGDGDVRSPGRGMPSDDGDDAEGHGATSKH